MSAPEKTVAKHQKHEDIPRPAYGHFHRNEWAILGAPCGSIKELAFALSAALSPAWKIAYADADHQGADQEQAQGRDTRSALAHGAALEYTDKITFHRFDREAQLDSYQYRSLFLEQDLVLINGNHFPGKRQIVITDPKKEASLQKKLDRLTQVDLILLTEGQEAPYPFLMEHLQQNSHPVPDILPLGDLAAIAKWLTRRMQQAVAPLYGLVLAGGKSVRMGADKGLINYHGQPQRDHAAQLLTGFCEKVFLSVRPDQTGDLDSPFPAISDTFLGLGPLGAILSAFREHPDAAWLVIACDLPMLNAETLQLLTEQRHTGLMATAFNSPVNHLPEPLIAIWEPRSYPVLLQFLAQGYACPRKALINSPIRLLEAPDAQALLNVNTPAELEQVQEQLQKK